MEGLGPTAGRAAARADLGQPFHGLQQLYDRSPLHRWLGLEVVEHDGGVLLRGHLQPVVAVDASRGIVHGGIVGALLDTAATFALIQHTGHEWFTVDLRIDFLRFAEVGPVEILGHVVRAGSGIGHAAAELGGPGGEPRAVASGTWVPMR
jgi:uncharacterized protein (TIGR00369 family)